MKIFFRVTVACCLVLAVVSHFKRKELGDVGALLEEVKNEPQQQKTSEQAFVFDYRGKDYNVDPVAEYELYGLVVTHNDIHAFSDIYHDKDSVDIKDICVIWGENAESDTYKEVQFWSEPWTCWTRWGVGEAIGFSLRDLSNNHLLSNDAYVRDTIYQMQIGDQIYLKGLLVNYSQAGHPNFVRKSSLNRDDEGNGACEVLFVEEAKILKKGPAFWSRVHFWSKRAGLVLILSWFIYFLREAYRPMFARSAKDD